MKTLTFLLSVVFLFSSWLSPAQEIGLQLSSLRKQFSKDAAEAMAMIKEMGFRQIEMGSTYGLSFPEFIKLIAQNELNVVSFEASFEKLEKFPQTMADAARSFGAKYVVCSGIPFNNGTNFTKEDIDKAAAVLNAAGKIIARNGLLLCYHTQGYEFKPDNKGTLFDYMVQTFDPRYVHFEMDVFWIKQAGQNPVELLRKYPTRFVLMHLKDRKHGTPTSENGHADKESSVALGTGDVGIAEIMKVARELGIQHYFIEDESSRAEEQIPKSLAYLKDLK